MKVICILCIILSLSFALDSDYDYGYLDEIQMIQYGKHDCNKTVSDNTF